MEERYHYDSGNRLTNREILSKDASQQSQMQYHYDAQGNMLSDGSRQFTYDAMNCLSEVKNLIAEGIAVKIDLSVYGNWKNVKWCCCIDENGIIHEAELK